MLTIFSPYLLAIYILLRWILYFFFGGMVVGLQIALYILRMYKIYQYSANIFSRIWFVYGGFATEKHLLLKTLKLWMFFGFISLCCHAIEAFSPKSMWIFTHFSTSTKLKICTWIFNLLMIHFHKIWPDHSVSLSVMTLFLSNVGSPFFPFNLCVYSWSHATLNNSSGFVKYFSFSFFFFPLDCKYMC